MAIWGRLGARACAHCLSALSNATTSRPRKTTCNVETDGVAERVNPKSRSTTGGRNRPHWPMAYKLRAPESIAAVASAARGEGLGNAGAMDPRYLHTRVRYMHEILTQ